jgi:hypothetical protein
MAMKSPQDNNTEIERPEYYDGDDINWVLDQLEAKIWNATHGKRRHPTTVEEAMKQGIEESKAINEAMQLAHTSIEALIIQARIDSENYVAEWFKDGVPQGFNWASWLAVARVIHDDDGKPINYKTTAEASAKAKQEELEANE